MTDSRDYDLQIRQQSRISPTGAKIVAEPKRLIGGGFAGSLDTMAWTANNSGAASAVNVTNIASLTSGTDAAGYAAIQTATKSRFLFASANVFRGTFRAAQIGVANSNIRWGAMNFGVLPAIQDGFFFSYDGSKFFVNACSNGVISSVSSENCIGDFDQPFKLDTNSHNYEIIYQVASVWFFVDGKLLHRLRPSTAQLSSTLTLAAAAISVNGLASAGATLESWAMSIVRYGSATSAPQVKNINALGTTTLKLGPGTLQRILVNAGGTGSNVVTIFDSTTASGLVLQRINSANNFVGQLECQYDFINGLTLQNATGTSPDITVIFD